MSFWRWSAVAGIATLTFLLAACGTADRPEAPTRELVVFAASSLTDALQEVSVAFEEATPGARVVINFAGSSVLRTQLELGANADVFASADERQMALAQEAGLLQGVVENFVTNLLVVVTPRGDEAIKSLQDLKKKDIRLVLALPDVPVGAYSLQSLERMNASAEFGNNFSDLALANVVSYEYNVLQVIGKVAIKEADAGIVYTTDGLRRAGSLTVIPIPAEFNVVARYPIAAIQGAREPELAQAFIDFLLAGQGQAVFRKFGFGSPTQ